MLIAVCVVINLLASPSSLWSAYPSVGAIGVYLCVLSSIFNKRRLYSILSICALTLPCILLAIDAIQSLDRVANLSEMSFALPYAVPGTLMGFLVTLDVLATANIKKSRYYYFALLPVTLISLVPQILEWIFLPPTPDYLTLACFFFAIANAIVITTFFWKRLKAEFRRKMHV